MDPKSDTRPVANSELPDAVDVVVVGYGFAGANAAIAAHDAGARVCVLEKQPDPGGISICSAGGVRIADDAQAALDYLTATNADTAPASVVTALADGMTTIANRVETLCRAVGATTTRKAAPGIYPFPGQDTFAFAMVDSLPDFDPGETYPHANALGSGAMLFQVLERNLARRGIPVFLDTPVERLTFGADRRVTGVRVNPRGGAGHEINATRGVVLCCGGFEADAALQAQYWQGKPVLSCAFTGNTGDGVRMAQSAGAALWHMWHYHGTYGFRVPGHPIGVRTKRLPDWYPRTDGAPPTFDGAIFDAGKAVKMPWILLDQDGRRFMNEYEPYMQDTGHRHFEQYRPETQSYPRIPAWIFADADGLAQFPWGQPLWNGRGLEIRWSPDNRAEVDAGIIHEAATLVDAAHHMGVPHNRLAAEVDTWNGYCDDGADARFERPATSMMPVARPPFYIAEAWPVVSNTQGGPVHDAGQRVLDPFDVPIPGLYAAGELGSVFGHLYLSGGNIAECFIGGEIAGVNAAGSL